MPAAKFVPQRFQNFVLPQHRHAAKTYTRLVNNSSNLSLAVIPSKEQVLRKKPGPKKHGPIAKMLKARCKNERFPSVRDTFLVKKTDAFVRGLFGDCWWSVKHTTRDEYETCLAMAYAIALDEGV